MKTWSENTTKVFEEQKKVNKTLKPDSSLEIEQQEIRRQMKLRVEMHLEMSQVRVQPSCIKNFGQTNRDKMSEAPSLMWQTRNAIHKEI